MFTSRAEYRLLLREDNADLRLTPSGRALGLVDEERWRAFSVKQEAIAREEERLRATWVRPGDPRARRLAGLLDRELTREATLHDLLRRPQVGYGDLVAPEDDPVDPLVAEQVEVQAKYHGYIERQRGEIERQRRHEETLLPPDLDYGAVHGLSTEVRQKLAERRPATLGQASRIPGVTPAAVSILLVHLKKHAGGLRRSA
jgi:tRNA uridine 5-carboxymethylaminomethyl modification enzyme